MPFSNTIVPEGDCLRFTRCHTIRILRYPDYHLPTMSNSERSIPFKGVIRPCSPGHDCNTPIVGYHLDSQTQGRPWHYNIMFHHQGELADCGG